MIMLSSSGKNVAGRRVRLNVASPGCKKRKGALCLGARCFSYKYVPDTVLFVFTMLGFGSCCMCRRSRLEIASKFGVLTNGLGC